MALAVIERRRLSGVARRADAHGHGLPLGRRRSVHRTPETARHEMLGGEMDR